MDRSFPTSGPSGVRNVLSLNSKLKMSAQTNDQALLRLLQEAQRYPEGSPEQLRRWADLSKRLDRPLEDPVERQLLMLVLEARCHPPRSPQRQRALTRLVQTIEQSGQLSRLRQYAQYFSTSAFADLYNEAKQMMFLNICGKPEQYQCQRPVMAWVNNRLKYMLLNIIKVEPTQPIQREPAAPDIENEHLRLSHFLQTDPEQRLVAYAVRNHPNVTFQFLAIARYVDGKIWREISTQTGVPLQTLSCFFQRTLLKLLPYFQRHL